MNNTAISPKQKLKNCFESVKNKIGDFKPSVALILGSGLGALADEIETVATIDYHEIEGFPISTIFGHKGRFVFGRIEGVNVVIMQGRVHFYEGYSMEDVVLPVRLMRRLGAEILYLTNASGGISFTAGDFMLITDHITSFVKSPLIGENFDKESEGNCGGERFPDMSSVYDKEISEAIFNAAKTVRIDMKRGVYVQTTGPNFETPAEVRMFKALGADAVGMSTACEAMVGNHCGMRVCGVSCVSNLACGLSDKPLSHAEVMEAADISAVVFKELIIESIKEFAKNKFVPSSTASPALTDEGRCQ